MNILVHSPNWIGDAVMAIPFIFELKKNFKDSKIYLICKEWVKPVFIGNPHIFKIITISKYTGLGIWETFNTISELSNTDFEIGFTLSTSSRSKILLWKSGALKRIGFSKSSFNMFINIPINPKAVIQHRSQKYLGLIDTVYKENNDYRIYISDEESIWSKNELLKLNIKLPVALCPYSVASSRDLPEKLIIKIIKNITGSILIFGSTKDKVKFENIVSHIAGENVFSILGKYTMRESILLLSQCQYTVATDSGLGHIAARLGIPTLSIFGAGRKEKTEPLGSTTQILSKNIHCSPCVRNTCRNPKHLECLNTITEDDIKFFLKKLQKR